MTEANKKLVRRYYEEVLNQRNVDRLDELAAVNFTSHLANGSGIGLSIYRRAVIGSLAAMPDLHVVVDDQIAEGDKVVVRFHAPGTHTGVFAGIQPTGKVAYETELKNIKTAISTMKSPTAPLAAVLPRIDAALERLARAVVQPGGAKRNPIWSAPAREAAWALNLGIGDVISWAADDTGPVEEDLFIGAVELPPPGGSKPGFRKL